MTKSLEALVARKGNSVTGNYYLAECGNCGEMFTSERMTGGEPIADTGDYGDCYCPHCNASDAEIIDCGVINSAVVEAWNFQQKHIDALIAALEQAQQENIELSRRGEIDPRTHEIINLRERIAELEARPLCVKLPDGWVMVPTEITKSMQDAWDSAPNGNEDDDENVRNAYRAMIAAAPKP